MKVIVYTKNIIENIEKSRTLVNVPISLMFKDFMKIFMSIYRIK